MNLAPGPRRDLVRALASEILHNYGHGRTLVAVDGADGSGTKQFADDLAELFRFFGHAAFRASINDFYRTWSERDGHGRDTGASYYHDTIDYSLLRRVLIDPYRMGGSTGFVTAGFDRMSNTGFEPTWESGPPDAVLIVDGVFLNRPEMRGLWHYSLLLQVPDEVAFARLDAASPGDGSAPAAVSNAALREAQELYVAESSPEAAATALIDNSDPRHPRRVFADSC